MSQSTPVSPTKDARMGVTAVAIALRMRYHKARDLMLQGKLGDVEQKGRHITVTRDAVESYKVKHE